MIFKPAQDILIVATFDFDRPIEFVVIMPHQSRHANPDGILRPADDAVTALRVVLEAENEFGEDFRIHVGQLHWPDFLDHVAGRSGKATTFAHLESRLQGNSDSPSRSIT